MVTKDLSSAPGNVASLFATERHGMFKATAHLRATDPQKAIVVKTADRRSKRRFKVGSNGSTIADQKAEAWRYQGYDFSISSDGLR